MQQKNIESNFSKACSLMQGKMTIKLSGNKNMAEKSSSVATAKPRITARWHRCTYLNI